MESELGIKNVFNTLKRMLRKVKGRWKILWPLTADLTLGWNDSDLRNTLFVIVVSVCGSFIGHP
jgi:hypothetical protein